MGKLYNVNFIVYGNTQVEAESLEDIQEILQAGDYEVKDLTESAVVIKTVSEIK